MPEGQQQTPKEGEKRKLLQYLQINAFKGILNFMSKLPGVRKLPGVGKFTYEARAAGRLTEEEIRKELRTLFDLNAEKITELKQIEAEWNLLDKIVFTGVKVENQTLPPLVEVYRKIGVYTDVDLAQREANTFEHGTYELEEGALEIDPEKTIKLPKIKINPESMIWDRFGRSIYHKEDICAFGHAKINELIAPLNVLKDEVRVIGTRHQPNVDVRGFALDLITALNTNLDKIRQIEEGHFNYLSKEIIPQTKRIEGIRSVVNLHKPDPKKIRFSHTYKIIKPFILVRIDEKAKRIKEDGAIVEEEIKSLKPVYFDPYKNPYKDELKEVNVRIDNLGGEGRLKTEVDGLDIQININKENLNQINKDIQKEISNAVKIDFKKGLLTDLYKELESNLMEVQSKDFLIEIRKRIGELSRVLKTEHFSFRDYELKIAELFEFINAKIVEFKIRVDNNRSRYFSDTLRRLKQQPYTQEKMSILMDLNNNLVILIKENINNQRIRLRGILQEVSNKINELADSQETEYAEKRNKLFDYILDLVLKETAGLSEKDIKSKKAEFDLEETEMKDSQVKRIKRITKNNLDRMINTENINKTRKLKDVILLKMGNLLEKRKTILKLLFEKEHLEFYIRTLKPNHPNFVKADDEVEYGLDENGYPLEIDSVTGEVLMDRWWKELSEHPTAWHEKIVKGEVGGKEVWEAKVDNGFKKHGIRKVDKRFIADVDALDMAIFIYNEWDSYRDDFRDGRYHPNSKSIMDYMIASNQGIIPEKPISIHFDPIILPTNKDYINFEPIKSEDLPDDEQKITQAYVMKVFNTVTNQFEDKVGTRKPTHLSPAFDRVALHNKGVLHWGRMYYYETSEGVTRWSKNPFPHVTTRGLAKYLIDRTIRGTYSFEEARNALKGLEWDYGRRHYSPDTGPYITDPLGEGGVLG